MTVYIDPPLWPAHGTLFSHVVSDASLDELHAFAKGAGIAARAFDRDHYDVGASRYEELIRRGAVPVSGGELVRILQASGLRVRARERPEKVRGHLARNWERLPGLVAETHGLSGSPLASSGSSSAASVRWRGAGEDLLRRWQEPHRSYHALPHLASVLTGIGILERAGELPAGLRPAVQLAGWYHDAVYAGVAGQDEEDSARLAEEHLDSLLPEALVSEVARLVRLTASHAPEPDDVAGAVLVDSDLEVLGREPAAYTRYVSQVRADYAHVADEQFAYGRSEVLRRLLEAPRLFRTRTGYELWENRARQNLESELEGLEQGRILSDASFSGSPHIG